MTNKEQIIAKSKRADVVFIDVDNTFCPGVGLEELAKFYHVEDQVRIIQKNVAEKSLSYDVAMEEIVKIINPSYPRFKAFLKEKTPMIATPGVKEFIDQVRLFGAYVYLISEGFTEIVNPTAKEVGIPREDIKGNWLLYYHDERCVGLDWKLLASQCHGKRKVVEQLCIDKGYRNVVAVGDGIDDFEACPQDGAFIGFGGNVVNSEVKSVAKWFVHSFHENVKELQDSS